MPLGQYFDSISFCFFVDDLVSEGPTMLHPFPLNYCDMVIISWVIKSSL